MLVNLFWFLCGAMIYKFSLYIFGLGNSINLFSQALVGCLLLVKKVDEQMLLILEKEVELLRKDQATQEQIDNIKNSKKQAHDLWRTMMIKTIISCCPSKIRSTLKFSDWESAMTLIKKTGV